MTPLMTFVATLLALSLQAQPLPNFAGTWTPVEGAPADRTVVVAQTATKLTVTRRGDEHPIEASLDGAATKQADELVEVSAKRVGDALVLTIATTTDFGDTTIRKETWTLDAGGRLIIERDRRGASGGVERVVYRRN